MKILQGLLRSIQDQKPCGHSHFEEPKHLAEKISVIQPPMKCSFEEKEEKYDFPVQTRLVIMIVRDEV